MVLAREANLVAARTRLEALVSEVELFDTQRAGLLLVIVEYERVLLYAFRHGGCVVTRVEFRCREWIATGRELQRGGLELGVVGRGIGNERWHKKSRNAGR